MNNRCSVADDRDVAFPEQQISALELRHVGCNSGTERTFLHIAVPRATDAAGRERNLHQPGTIDAETRLATPKIGYAEEFLGNGNEVTVESIERNNVPARHIASR